MHCSARPAYAPHTSRVQRLRNSTPNFHNLSLRRQLVRTSERTEKGIASRNSSRLGLLAGAGLLLAAGLAACAVDTLSTKSLIEDTLTGDTPPEGTPPATAPANVFITLGTNGGPVADVARSQPANALQVDGDLYLVDAGDGAVTQMIRAGLNLRSLQGIFLSHLHFDHTGGVLGVLGARLQTDVTSRLTIYGPPGTKHFIDGLMAGVDPVMKAAYGMPGQEWRADLEVKELVHDSVVELNGLTVLTAENSHFAIPESTAAEKAKSLSFRFDMADRSIVFTGDTGPSENVEILASGADLLVSEMMDIPAILSIVRRNSPNLPPERLANVEWHFRAHHLTPVQVGELASAAEVGAVLITHMAPSIATEAEAQAIVEAVNSTYEGNVIIPEDLDRF